MSTVNESAGNFAVISSTAAAGKGATAASGNARAQRDGAIPIGELIDDYMAEYAGQDDSRPQRLRWWTAKLGNVRLVDLTDDHIFLALEELACQRGRYYAGADADDRPIFRAKRRPMAPATINRYAAALSAVLTWAVKRRVAPRGWENPCKGIERRTEDNEVVRFLSDVERIALLRECKKSTWSRLYLFVMIGLTTGARRGEIERMRWGDFDLSLEQPVCSVNKTKNGDRKVLPLVPAVVEEIRRHLGAPTALVFASRRRPDVAFNHVPSWHRALKDAGIRNFRFHDLRHSCASYLAQNGASLLQIADVLGHRSLSVTQRYAHLATKHKSDLINRVLGGIE